MFDAASYYPQLLAAALNPVRFIEPIVKLRNFIKLSAGQVYMVEAKMKSKAQSKEHWKTDHRMAMLGWEITKSANIYLKESVNCRGGALSLLGGCLIDIVSHVIDECATRAIGTTSRSPARPSCDSFATFQLTFPSGTLCSGTIAFSDVFDLELVVTCSRGVFRLDSSLNVTSSPPHLMESMHPRTESVIEIKPASTSHESAEDQDSASVNESENAGSSDLPEKDEAGVTDIKQDGEEKTFAETGAQTIAIETGDATTETTNENIQFLTDRESLVKMGLPKLLEAVKDSFLTGGIDSRSWNESSINDSPIGKFSDILYVQGVLDALRRSDKSGEVENVESGNELKLEQLHFQAEFGTYVETVDHLQI
ncbi:unnamed protein product [Oikopleura dioica]|uniref:Uncharacterized protein n=1 Tax=Oikopleura dioica TaxID=34765 RepID=E4Y8Y1_OIKDI|nr:unnamed protein product [Oikopleura dioica]